MAMPDERTELVILSPCCAPPTPRSAVTFFEPTTYAYGCKKESENGLLFASAIRTPHLPSRISLRQKMEPINRKPFGQLRRASKYQPIPLNPTCSQELLLPLRIGIICGATIASASILVLLAHAFECKQLAFRTGKGFIPA
jgi:hypothetical protein